MRVPSQPPNISKENQNESNSSDAQRIRFDNNFPIPGAKGTPALIKVYDDQEDFKLNMTIEFYGILSPPDFDEAFPEPALPDPSYLSFEPPEERMARRPPHSLAPRIHAISWQPLRKNPALPSNPNELSQKIVQVQANAVQLREELLSILERKLGGDRLAAQYLLYNLLSSVYNRASFLPLGNLPLNLFNWPREMKDLPFKMGTFLSNLVPKLHSISITTQNFNQEAFRLFPVKNYLQNKLETGQLQLSSGTMLLLSETELASGSFSPEGLKKLNSLAQLIKWQKVAYDFQHYQADFETDLNVLILSWARSILAKDNPLCLQLPVCYTSGEDFLHNLDSLSSILRCYVSLLKEIQMEQINEDAQEVIQSQFVEQRQVDPSVSTEDLHVWLTLARYEAMSRGDREVKVQHWKEIMEKEKERRSRFRDYLAKLR
uniref:Uncharacterized protein n=1 Tax=Arcella intermedia TaxID=1963864 RepID=A0A6B2L4Q9_9EUKA|eukprot:TRINITY_DN14045_c0_g1_i1.p1 TRINITY_DN14045_c0_g1~~TRINITY_DN14045_c0_g1_i1.p1  ORF type:complete len:432 (+),score=102.07 TRINITY_DN14045_c0_g1_i1:525-1820(+)